MLLGMGLCSMALEPHPKLIVAIPFQMQPRFSVRGYERALYRF